MEDDFFEYIVTKDLLTKLRDKSKEAELEAKLRYKMWIEACEKFALKELHNKFKLWGLKGEEGDLVYSDGDEHIIVEGVRGPRYWAIEEDEPQINYRRELKTKGRFSKSVSSVGLSYFIKWFTPSTLPKKDKTDALAN